MPMAAQNSAGLQVVPEPVEHGDRPGEDELGLPAAPHHELPDAEDDADGGELRPQRGPERASGTDGGRSVTVSRASRPASCWSDGSAGGVDAQRRP